MDPGTPLNLLVVDSQSTTCLPLTDYLRSKGHRCQIQNSAQGAFDLLERVAADRWPRVLLCHFPPTDTDGLEFVHVMKQRHPDLTILCYGDLNRIAGVIFEQLERLDIRFLSLPIDFHRLDATVGALTSRWHRKASQDGSDQPFFGTDRHVRRETTRHGLPTQQGISEWADQPPATSQPVAPVSRKPPVPDDDSPYPPQFATPVDRLPTPAPAPSTHSIVRPPAPPPVTTTTSRFRRGITGRITKAPVPAESPVSERLVRCPACRQTFAVAVRHQSYSLPCVHCGSVNRVDPS